MVKMIASTAGFQVFLFKLSSRTPGHRNARYGLFISAPEKIHKEETRFTLEALAGQNPVQNHGSGGGSTRQEDNAYFDDKK
jgi:hypothetical protein